TPTGGPASAPGRATRPRTCSGRAPRSACSRSSPPRRSRSAPGPRVDERGGPRRRPLRDRPTLRPADHPAPPGARPPAARGGVPYMPVLLTATGRVAADTKQYFYLDPGRLLARAGYLWQGNTAFGTVTHENIGYLFPAGPYYWVTEQLLGLPAWVAQRLWLG